MSNCWLLSADGACWFLLDLEGSEGHGERVIMEKPPYEGLTFAGDEFDCFRGLYEADDSWCDP